MRRSRPCPQQNAETSRRRRARAARGTRAGMAPCPAGRAKPEKEHGAAGPRCLCTRHQPGLQGHHAAGSGASPASRPRRFRARRAGERSRGARMEAVPLRYISARRHRARLSRAVASWLTAVRWALRRPSPGISRSGRLRCRHGEAGERWVWGRERGRCAGPAAWPPCPPGGAGPRPRKAPRPGGARGVLGRWGGSRSSHRAGGQRGRPAGPAVPFPAGAAQGKAEGRRPQPGVSGADPASCPCPYRRPLFGNVVA